MNRIYLPYPPKPPLPPLRKRFLHRSLNLLHHLLWWPFLILCLLATLAALLLFLVGAVTGYAALHLLERTAPGNIQDSLVDDLKDSPESPSL